MEDLDWKTKCLEAAAQVVDLQQEIARLRDLVSLLDEQNVELAQRSDIATAIREVTLSVMRVANLLAALQVAGHFSIDAPSQPR